MKKTKTDLRSQDGKLKLKQKIESHEKTPFTENRGITIGGEKLLDKQDLLQLFHMSEKTLQNWRKQKILPYIQPGKKIYYYESDVVKMLKKAYNGIAAIFLTTAFNDLLFDFVFDLLS